MSTVWDMGVPTHWGGSVICRSEGGQGIYCPLPEHGRRINCDTSYHGLASGGGAEAGNTPIQAMVGSNHPVYPGDKAGACSSRGGGGDMGRIIRGRRRVGYGSMKERELYGRITRDVSMKI